MWNTKCPDEKYSKRKINVKKNVPYTHVRFATLKRNSLKVLSIPHSRANWCPCAASGSLKSTQGKVASVCVLLGWSLWQLFGVVSELDVDVNFQQAKTSGFATTNWGLQGACYVKELLENHWHPKKTWNASEKPSGGVRVNQFVSHAISYKFHFRLYMVFCTNTSKNFTRFNRFKSWNPMTL